jgi:hypothetical protein
MHKSLKLSEIDQCLWFEKLLITLGLVILSIHIKKHFEMVCDAEKAMSNRKRLKSYKTVQKVKGRIKCWKDKDDV